MTTTVSEESLLDDLHILASAPNGIGKLRELILQLAVQGRLVSQDARDGTARELLAGVEEEKQALFAKREIKRPKKLLPVSENEKDRVIPETWAWVRFGTVVSQRLGKMLDKAKNRGLLRLDF